MDRQVNQSHLFSTKNKKRLKIISASLLIVSCISYFSSNTSGTSLTIDPVKLVFSDARQGDFQEFLPLRGTVLPQRVIYLDAIDGGRVEQVFVEEGEMIQAGDKILELSNTSLQLNVLAREADVSEQINNLRNTRLAMKQSRLEKKTTLLDIEYRIKVLLRRKAKTEILSSKQLVAKDSLHQIIDELDYQQRRLALMEESLQQEREFHKVQLKQLESNVKALQSNLKISRKSLDNLTLLAPFSGQLTFLNAEIGESMSEGKRLGQIDVLDNFKVLTQVDEFYINRVTKGQIGRFTLNGTEHELAIFKIYPGVTNGQFEVEWRFKLLPPNNIRRGQSLQIKLEMSDSQQSMVVDQGGFYQDTGGNWVFVLDPNGQGASKRLVKLGKRNNQLIQVLSGLKIGERIIASSYGEFSNMDRLKFSAE
ncbi:MAG: hypothetical protein COA86_07310 [Kangiella sp.]|nr:MAG: hypothetical protein COA86_07310 [Kangiella sp.]